ncbi:MAG TPA: tetratricopeptide repeat protein, partial [bacterium]|nr:tetratricopeptide repeat protein [bacterium]
EDYSAKYALAELLRKKGDLDEALQLLNQLPADIRKQVPVLNSQAQIYWNQNKPELALAVLELGPWRQQKAMDQATMDYRYLMAQVLLTLGKDKRALTQLRRIFAQNPDYKDVASLITQLTGN